MAGKFFNIKKFTPQTRLFVGLLCIVLGTFTMLLNGAAGSIFPLLFFSISLVMLVGIITTRWVKFITLVLYLAMFTTLWRFSGDIPHKLLPIMPCVAILLAVTYFATKRQLRPWPRRFMAILSLPFMAIMVATFSHRVVEESTADRIYSEVEKTPHNKAGLLLGTSKFLRSGINNEYYENRIEATIALFKAGKIDYVIISGDNSRKEYDEPTDMKNDLIAAGVPAERIYLDYAGFRTLDSVVRCKAIFGQKSITVISQRFHDERAIYLAQHNDIEAVGFAAKDVQKMSGLKTRAREYLARTKMFIDLLFNKQPKFLGEKIAIP